MGGLQQETSPQFIWLSLSIYIFKTASSGRNKQTKKTTTKQNPKQTKLNQTKTKPKPHKQMKKTDQKKRPKQTTSLQMKSLRQYTAPLRNRAGGWWWWVLRRDQPAAQWPKRLQRPSGFPVGPGSFYIIVVVHEVLQLIYGICFRTLHSFISVWGFSCKHGLRRRLWSIFYTL